MDVTTARTRLDEFLVVDVREDDEWAAGRIEGAVHVPLGELPARLAELPAGRTVLTLCCSGKRSERAAALLTAAGRPVEDLDGGMQAWERAGLPVTTPDGRPGRVA